jgi:hypothetical protein
MQSLLTFFFTVLIFSFQLNAQLNGKITDSKGESLPFTNVYIEGTTRGTTANTEGYYSLDLENGAYRIVFQYIGYEKKIMDVKINGKTNLDVMLKPNDIELKEFVLKSNAEDPAYPIMRQAIAMRRTYRDQVKAYSCDAYIKGLQKVLDAPKKIMGRDIGDMGGSLDTNTRQGIVYLSETISKLYVDGNKKKEELISSKVSGNSNGFGFNRATMLEMNIYEQHIEIMRQILSPIADNAMQYYRYRLEGQFKDEAGNTVYKIAVLPIRKEDPTFGGTIYIVDNQWNIYQTDLFVTGKSIQQPVLDTLYLKQNHVAVGKVWRLLSQSVSFKFGIFGIKISGSFNGVFSNYNLTPQYPPRFFTNEIFKASKGEKDNDMKHWDTLRPMPLTLEERLDYVKKDSIQVVHQSKVWLDSVNTKNNKFKFMNLLTGYTYRNSWNRWFLTIGSPLSVINFNPVQGWNIASPTVFEKRFGTRFQPFKSSIKIAPSVSYSFVEKAIRVAGSAEYLFNRFNYAKLKVEGGQTVAQFSENNPVAKTVAQLYAIYDKKNFNKIYDKIFFKISYGQEIVNSLSLEGGLEWAERRPLSNNTQFSVLKKEQVYSPNYPNHPSIISKIQELTEPWEHHQAYFAFAKMTWKPGQKYLSYPNFKEIEDSKLPTVSLSYQKCLGKIVTDQFLASAFDRLRLSIEQKQITMGLFGYTELRGEYGGFFKKNTVQFIDYQHFNGNETSFGNPEKYMTSFLNLPYYRYSTTGNYVMFHAQHHFEGFLLDKIPLIRKLGLKEVFRAAYLNTPELGNYTELSFGIDNIGFGLFRLLRLDVSWQLKGRVVSSSPVFMIGIKL